MLQWTCPDCGMTYQYPEGVRIMAFVEKWDYCPNDGRLSQRDEYTRECQKCHYTWKETDGKYTKDCGVKKSHCPECNASFVLTTDIRKIETLITEA